MLLPVPPRDHDRENDDKGDNPETNRNAFYEREDRIGIGLCGFLERTEAVAQLLFDCGRQFVADDRWRLREETCREALCISDDLHGGGILADAAVSFELSRSFAFRAVLFLRAEDEDIILLAEEVSAFAEPEPRDARRVFRRAHSAIFGAAGAIFFGIAADFVSAPVRGFESAIFAAVFFCFAVEFLAGAVSATLKIRADAEERSIFDHDIAAGAAIP